MTTPFASSRSTSSGSKLSRARETRLLKRSGPSLVALGPQPPIPLHRYPNDIYLCPITGIKIPKDPVTNQLWRADWLGKARDKSDARADLFEACRASLILTCNLLFWSYLKNAIDGRGREVNPESPHYPAITFPCQDEALTTLVDCIEKREPVIGWKTREMGFSWMVIWTFTWYLLFHEAKDFLVMSRAEDLVDKTGDPDSLFWKFRYLLDSERMPAFIAPREGKNKIVDVRMHIDNPRTKSHIDGRATTSHSGAGGRRNAVLLDEFSRVEGARGLWETMTDTNRCRIAVSTPLRGSFFNQLYEEGKTRTILMPWWHHPWKGRKMEWVKEPTSKTAMSLSGWYATSPWYRLQATTRSESDLAENIDCNPKGSRELFFDADAIDRHKGAWAIEPTLRGDIVYDTAIDPTQVDSNMRQRLWETVEFQPSRERTSPWSLWLPLEEDERTGIKRPPQDRAYVAFADISKGNGSSNTVFAFFDIETHEQVAEYASPHAPPHVAARLFVAAACWFGGVLLPLLGWEANGDGIIFGGEVMKLEYPMVYYQELLGQSGEQTTKRYGWSSNASAKVLLVGKLRTEIENDTALIRSAATLDETLQYIRYPDGSIGPASLVDEQTGARAAHGDRVIAASGGVMLLEKYRDFTAEKHGKPKEGSFAHRHQQRLLTPTVKLQDWS